MKIIRILLAISLLCSNSFVYTTESISSMEMEISSIRMARRKTMEEIDGLQTLFMAYCIFMLSLASIVGIIQFIHVKSLQIKKHESWLEWLKFWLSPSYPLYNPYIYYHPMYAPMMVYY